MLKYISTALFVLLIISSNKISAQYKNDFEAGVSNMAFGGIVGGLGALINKKPNERAGKVFLKGFSQGALGGYLVFESKRLIGKFSNTGDYTYVWPAKLVNSAGTSIMENAASNRNFWEKWHLNIGFNRLELHTKDKLKLSYRIMPFAFGSTIYGFTKGKMDFNESLKIGTFVFNAEEIGNDVSETQGRTISNIILIQNNYTFKKELILGHELIHTYQYESFVGFNAFLNKPIENLNDKIKFIRIYHDIFYTDYNFLSYNLIYTILGNKNDNFFEKEANFFTGFQSP